MTQVYEALRSEPDQLIALLASRDREIVKLQNHIANANKKLFGAKTEKLTSDQIKFSFDAPAVPEQQSLEQEVVVEKHTRTIQRGRKPLPGDLPREQVVYQPEETTCPCCRAELVTIGEECSEELEKVPAQLKVIEHIRVKKACPSCKGAGVLVAPLPATVFPLERSRPGPGLLADIIVSKFVDHLPLHRQEEMYLRKGIELRRQRMCDWLAAVAELLIPLYQELKLQILTLPYIHADETTLKVQDGAEEGKCHTGYLWGLLGPPNLVWFHYAPSRAGEVPARILDEYQGALHTDAYAGYNQVLIPDKCVRLACLAHVRRKFLDIQKIAGKDSAHVLTLIAKAYRLESSLKTPEQRFAVRQTKTRELFDALFSYLKAWGQRTLPKSPVMGAIQYALNQEQEVYRILENGAFDLDNNAIERQIRPVALGRKNYLFAGSHEGAHHAALFYSLLNTCKLNKVEPWEWLKDVLVRVSSDRSASALTLLPHKWRKTAL